MMKINKTIDEKLDSKIKMLLQIHDELVFECPKNELEKIKAIIKKDMLEISNNEHHKFSIPLTVDINSGNNWGEAH